MTDPTETYRWHKQFAEAWTEKRPARQPMTDTERLDFLGEYCDRHEYIKPQHIITDCLGQKTVGSNFREAIDIAAAKFKEANE